MYTYIYVYMHIFYGYKCVYTQNTFQRKKGVLLLVKATDVVARRIDIAHTTRGSPERWIPWAATSVALFRKEYQVGLLLRISIHTGRVLPISFKEYRVGVFLLDTL